MGGGRREAFREKRRGGDGVHEGDVAENLVAEKKLRLVSEGGLSAVLACRQKIIAGMTAGKECAYLCA